MRFELTFSEKYITTTTYTVEADSLEEALEKQRNGESEYDDFNPGTLELWDYDLLNSEKIEVVEIVKKKPFNFNTP